MLNVITIGGRLTKDPELRTTQSGVSVCSFSVAVERDYAPEGQKKETDFFDVVVWRQTAEFVSKYFHKGDMIMVSGRMESRKYTGNDGIERKVWEIQNASAYFGGNKKDGSGQTGGYQSPADYYAQQGQYGAQSAPAQAPAQPQYTQPQFNELDDDDGELPF